MKLIHVHRRGDIIFLLVVTSDEEILIVWVNGLENVGWATLDTEPTSAQFIGMAMYIQMLETTMLVERTRAEYEEDPIYQDIVELLQGRLYTSLLDLQYQS